MGIENFTNECPVCAGANVGCSLTEMAADIWSGEREWETLRCLMKVLLSTDDPGVAFHLELALKAVGNRKAVLALIHQFLEQAGDSEERLRILECAIVVSRGTFLYAYLSEYFSESRSFSASRLYQSFLHREPTDWERKEILRFFRDTRIYQFSLYKQLMPEEAADVRDEIVSLVRSGSVSSRMLRILGENLELLSDLQEDLRSILSGNPDRYLGVILPYLDLRNSDAQELARFARCFSVLWRKVSMNVFGIDGIVFDSLQLKLASQICNSMSLDDSEWDAIFDLLQNEALQFEGLNKVRYEYYKILEKLSEFDKDRVFAFCISLYENAEVYSGRMLEFLMKMGSEYAYQVGAEKMLHSDKFGTKLWYAKQLIKNYPSMADRTFEIVATVENEKFLENVKDYYKKAFPESNEFVRSSSFSC